MSTSEARAVRTAGPFEVSRRLLVGWFGVMVAMGYSAALFIHTPLWGWHQERVAVALWGDAAYPAQAEAYRAWAMGIFGPTLAAWAVVVLWLLVGPLARRERWAWWAIVTSLLAWAPVDTAVSVAHGVWINVVFNGFGFGIPMVLLGLCWPGLRPASGEAAPEDG